jgi:hypothetical protein
MKLLMIAAATACILTPTAALAQESDDWEYGEDPATGLAAAVSRYDTGQAIVVQCRAGELSVVVQGLELGEGRRDVRVARSGGARDDQPWRAVTPNAAGAQMPGRAARMLRGGGAVQFRTLEGAPAARLGLELPAESVNVDRVLTACGRPLQDERDALPVFRGELDQRSVERVYMRRDVQAQPTGGIAAAEVSCIVGEDLRLRDCRVDQTIPTSSPFGLEHAERLTGVQVVPTQGQVASGTIHVVSWSSGPVVVVERTVIVPAD